MQKLLVKLIEVVENGVGGLLQPMQIRRVGRATAEVRAHEMRLLAQAENDVAEIRAGRMEIDTQGNLVVLPPPKLNDDSDVLHSLRETPAAALRIAQSQHLLESALTQRAVQDLQRAINLKRIVMKAEEEANAITDEEVSDDPISPDWFSRWRNNAEDVTNDHMQQLWARILTGEVAKPGSFSLHTLDSMRNLSQQDAELIARIASFKVCTEEIVCDEATRQTMEGAGISLTHLFRLSELGIIASADTALVPSITFYTQLQSSFQRLLVCNERALLAEHEDAQNTFALPYFPVTQVGRELMRLGKFSANEEYLLHVGELIKEQGFTVTLGDWKPHVGNTGVLQNRRLI